MCCPAKSDTACLSLNTAAAVPAQPALVPLPAPGVVNPSPPPSPPPQAPVFMSSPPIAADPAPPSHGPPTFMPTPPATSLPAYSPVPPEFIVGPAPMPTPALTTAVPPVWHPVPPEILIGPAPAPMPAPTSSSPPVCYPVPPEYAAGSVQKPVPAPTSSPPPVFHPVPSEYPAGPVISPPPSHPVIGPAQPAASSSPPASPLHPASPRAASSSVSATHLPAPDFKSSPQADGAARLREQPESDAVPMPTPNNNSGDPPNDPTRLHEEDFPALGAGNGKMQSTSAAVRVVSAPRDAATSDGPAQPAPVRLAHADCCAFAFILSVPSLVPADDPHASSVSGSPARVQSEVLNSKAGVEYADDQLSLPSQCCSY